MNIDPKRLSKLVGYMTTFDGGVYYSSKTAGNCKFIMNMRKENEDYILWVKQTLENITSVSIREPADYNTDGCTRKPLLRLESRAHPYFTKIRERVYIDNHKVIDPHLLKQMDAEALAIIFMCDGGTHLDLRFKNPHASISLHTKGYSYADNMALSKSIYKNLGIVTNVNRHNKYWFLRVSTKSHKKFYDEVNPYVCPSFAYKFERIAPVISGW